MIEKILLSGWTALGEYLSAHVITCLIPAFFIAGAITIFISSQFIIKWVGNNNLSANLLASIIGAFSHFETLTEVPIVKALTDLGMSKGQALSFLLAGPSLSLPNMMVINKIMGYQIQINTNYMLHLKRL